MRYNPIQKLPCFTSYQLTLLFSAILLLSIEGHSQSYYSNFSAATGNYTSGSPSGLLCLAPSFSNDQNLATADLTDYAQVSGLLSVALTCTNSDYFIRARLNLPSGTSEAPAGYTAGFRVRFGSVASLALLQSNLSLKTYLAGSIRETIPANNLAGITLLTGGSAADIFFTSSLSFDEVELDFNTSVLPVAAAFDYRFYYAFATPAILPVKLAAFSAAGQTKAITLTWSTASETGTARFEVQRSSGAEEFITIGVISVKPGAGSQATYSYSDKSNVSAGEVMYRLKIMDRDGSVEYSKVISITTRDASIVQVYPNYIQRGQPITILSNSNNTMQAHLMDVMGNLLSTHEIKGRSLVPTSNLNHGMYLLKVTDGKKIILTQKIIVQ